MAAAIFRQNICYVAPVATSSISYFLYSTSSENAKCEEQQDPNNIPEVIKDNSTISATTEAVRRKAGFKGGNDNETFYNNLFPLRQLFQPAIEYPLWDDNWDGNAKLRQQYNSRALREHGTTKHIILVRHGQYDETFPEDEKRVLTPLGREQAELTGLRIAELVNGVNELFGPCHVKAIHVSNMKRAKETADIIAKYLPVTVQRSDPDPLLNEGRPCHMIPCGKVTPSVVKKTDEQHARIEEGFNKYIYTAPPPPLPLQDNNNECESKNKHEFEIIVCHGNVIRYFFCRALQLPPEAWLRLCTFNCSLTYFTIRPSGSVSCRTMGDIGHLPYGKSTFSMHHGFNW